MLNNITETTMLRSTGKSPISQSPAASGMPFKDQHLKQLRAQCLVYLAFRYISMSNVLPSSSDNITELCICFIHIVFNRLFFILQERFDAKKAAFRYCTRKRFS